ncbi:AAA-like domain-containing protein [Nostoc sp. FACHB-87]|uniref:AAA-like domain-containing protein n=1 Tax=Nostocaceae TaxID=1162 RepID=UPI0016874BB1|nr:MULTISPECIES: AAA-like domain-containing protein [Nostocaceae]MBD2455269.1 AAA-like domain-containing protein [Nostoc sp. FACHB-87]MBD2476906.1 AAA-like domain-containing protein [Anabaena sp. FACHB-83]
MPSDNQLQLWDNNLPKPEELVKILERTLGNTGSDEDMAVLQKVLSILPEQNRVQLGSYIVNIAQGNTIHIGNRITYQIDAEIKAILQQLQQAFQPNHQEPAADNTFAIPKLEYPDGLVSLNSPFYIQYADIESLCYETLVQPASLIRIKAPKLMGKTSLLIRIRYHAENQNYRVFYLDFGSVEKAVLSNLDTFLRWLCGKVSDELDLNNKVKNVWNTDILSSNDNCTAYFNKHILAHINSPVVLILDEVDRLFLPENQELVVNFFGMLRSWHEKGKFNRDWEKLRLVLAHSTEAHIPLDIHQSPFNAGVPVELGEFNRQQVEDLAQRHQIEQSDALTVKLMSMVGGHPYLVRLAMYYIAAGKITLEDLLDSATTEAGIYSNHLRSLLDILQGKPKLAQALKKVVDSPVPVALDSMQIYQLHSLGLVQIQKNEVIPRCLLYREYFHRVLSGS